MKQSEKLETTAHGLVTSEKLLEILFPDESARPTRRWLEMQCKAKRLPHFRLGRLIRFDPARVRDAINGQRTAQYGVAK